MGTLVDRMRVFVRSRARACVCAFDYFVFGSRVVVFVVVLTYRAEKKKLVPDYG